MSITLPDARQLSDEALQTLRGRAVRGIELGFTETELADLLGISRETISRWWSAYASEGLDALPQDRTGRPLGSGRLVSDEQARHIQHLIDTNPPEHLGIAHALWTRRAVGDLIRQEFGIDLAERTVGEYLRRWGDPSQKPARHARKQEPDEAQQWREETDPLIERRAQEEDAEILWCDETGVAADHHPGCGSAREGERAPLEVPDSHIRVNQISAISTAGTVRFMTYTGMLNAATFRIFLTKLVHGTSTTIFLIADRLRAHPTDEVTAGVEAHQGAIEVFDRPRYSPEMNPVEDRNNDLNGAVNEAGLPDDRETLHGRILGFMNRLVHRPKHVISYFLHPCVQYAAPIEL